jgi:hypothetical protein
MEKVKRYASKTSLAIVVFVTLELFILNPAVAVSNCNIVCESSFVIDEIDTAADLEALSGCTTVTGDLSIEYSPLTSLEGLECLAHVGGRLDIKLNESLTSLAGLNNLEYVGGDLGISVNRSLASLAGLNNLEFVGGRVDISYNFSLTSLAGLNKLESVGGNLDISINRSLISLAGLNKLESVGGNLVIWYNRKLCTNLAEALRDRLLDNGGIGGSIHISINKPGC